MIRTLIASIAVAITPLGASASETDGRWDFRTDIEEKGCTITGQMMISPASEDTAVRACEFVTTELCGAEDPQPTSMRQSCRVIAQGDFLLIRSQVEESLTDGVPAARYLPDNFTVKPDGSARMVGRWYDRLYADSVEFWRPKAVPVS